MSISLTFFIYHLITFSITDAFIISFRMHPSDHYCCTGEKELRHINLLGEERLWRKIRFKFVLSLTGQWGLGVADNYDRRDDLLIYPEDIGYRPAINRLRWRQMLARNLHLMEELVSMPQKYVPYCLWIIQQEVGYNQYGEGIAKTVRKGRNKYTMSHAVDWTRVYLFLTHTPHLGSFFAQGGNVQSWREALSLLGLGGQQN